MPQEYIHAILIPIAKKDLKRYLIAGSGWPDGCKEMQLLSGVEVGFLTHNVWLQEGIRVHRYVL